MRKLPIRRIFSPIRRALWAVDMASRHRYIQTYSRKTKGRSGILAGMPTFCGNSIGPTRAGIAAPSAALQEAGAAAGSWTAASNPAHHEMARSSPSSGHAPTWLVGPATIEGRPSAELLGKYGISSSNNFALLPQPFFTVVLRAPARRHSPHEPLQGLGAEMAPGAGSRCAATPRTAAQHRGAPGVPPLFAAAQSPALVRAEEPSDII